MAQETGWSAEEEKAFRQLQEAGWFERLPAIRLYRRFNGDLNRALEAAKQYQRWKQPLFAPAA